MNMGPHNRTDLYRLVEWIDARYPDRQYLRVYPHLLFDSESDPPEARTLAAKQRRTEEMIALEDFCAARGYEIIELDGELTDVGGAVVLE